jgi:CBS domain-containing protein
MRVEQIMKRPHWAPPETTVEMTAQWMRDVEIGFLPVCTTSGQILGTITDRDLAIRVLGSGLPGSTPVREVMTPRVIAVHAKDSLRRAELLMAHERVARLVVTDDDGTLVGVISLSDIAAHERAGRAGRLLKEVVRRETHAS